MSKVKGQQVNLRGVVLTLKVTGIWYVGEDTYGRVVYEGNHYLVKKNGNVWELLPID